MSTSSPNLWQRPPGRLLRFVVPIAAAVGVAAAAAGVLVPAAGRVALAVPALFLLLFVPVAARLSRQIEERFRDTARLAYLDELTELPNRALFKQEVERAIAEAPDENAAVLLLDLDRFREINETFGHNGGDRVLREVGERLDRLEPRGLRGFVLARLGADEFGIVLRTGAGSVSTTARRALDVLAPPFEIDGIPLAVGARIGAAVYPDHGEHVDVLLRRADIAMSAAKQRRTRVELYDPRADRADAERLALAGELGRALANDELALFFQPKVALVTGRIVGVEALVRWRHPTRGLLLPSEFVAFAERTGLIRPLSRHLLEQAIRQCSLWQTAAPEVGVSVNLTEHDIVDPDLPAEIGKLLAEAGLPAPRLELEVTERAIGADPFRVRRTLLRLSELGVRIAIDDFGRGSSSLGYLRRLPLDGLKIDRSFVTSMARNANDAAIVRSAIDLGRNLGLTVTAEGVEDAQSLELLKELGCAVAQGYFTGEPAPAELLTELLVADRPVTRPARRGPRRLVTRPDPENPLKLLS
jgi:diguanylate cyclase (GGDEF)-like protein